MDASKMANFVLSGEWPGEKRKIKPEQWERYISYFLSRSSDIFKSMSGFSPISSLINNKEKQYFQLFTDVNTVLLSEGIDLNTHCYQVSEKVIKNFELVKKEKSYQEKEKYLITRKKEWIIWYNYYETTFLKDCKGDVVGRMDISKFSKFELSNLATILSRDASMGFNIIDSIFLWFSLDIDRTRETLAQKEIIMNLAQQIHDRARNISF